MNRKFLWGLVLCCCSVTSLQASENLPDREVVMQILSENPAVLSARKRVEVEQAQKQKLEAGPYEWAMTLEAQRRRTDVDKGNTANTRDWAVGMERAWRLPGKAALDEELGAQGVDVAQASAAGSRQEVARLLLSSWFQWLRSRARLDQATDEMALLKREAGIVKTRYGAGDAANLENMQAEAALAQIEATRFAAEADHLGDRETLQQLFPELPLPENLALSEPPVLEGDVATWVEAQLNYNQALKALRLEARRSGLQATRADRERIADPTVGVRMAREQDGETRLLGLTVSIPLGGAVRQAEAARSLAESGAVAQQEAQMLRQVKAEARTAYQRVISDRLTWVRSQEAARQLEQAARLQARAYTLGESSLPDLLTARRLAHASSLEAKLARLSALERYYRLLLDSHELWPFDSSENGSEHGSGQQP